LGGLYDIGELFLLVFYNIIWGFFGGIGQDWGKVIGD
jgi:hypothetical protein